MKKLLMLLLVPALVLVAAMGWAKTFTTPTIDGIITGDGTDWDVCEDFATLTFDNADYTLWITWDEATGLYVGLDRQEDPDNKFLGDDGDGVISLYVAIDTDQMPGSGALYDGYSTVSFSSSSAHLPEYIFYFTGGSGWYEWSVWNQLNDAWDWMDWRDDGTYYGWNGGPIDDEVTILWSDIGYPLGIGVTVWITYDTADPWPPVVVAAWPEENPVGLGPVLTWAYEFYNGHYYCSPGVPALCDMPACNICPDLTDHSVPVALSSFVATGQAGAIEVSWTSQTEINALAYHLQRSNTAEGQYEEIARLEAQGNSETPVSYQYRDEDVVAGQTYYYMLVDEDLQGNRTQHGPVFAAAAAEVPGAYSLMPNYPNPFNPSTAIAYQTPQDGHVTLTIYNVLGQEIRTLVDTHQAAGTHTAMWDGTDAAGHHLNSGVYFYTMKAGNFTQTRKMVLMR
jgi:hypothetical protein